MAHLIHFPSVLVAAAVTFLLGWLWYSPLMFGKLWMRLSKVDCKQHAPAGQMALIMFSGFGANFIKLLVLQILMIGFAVRHFHQAAFLAVLVWVGFICTTALASVLWEKKPVLLYLLNISYELVSFLIAAAIFIHWR